MEFQNVLSPLRLQSGIPHDVIVNNSLKSNNRSLEIIVYSCFYGD